MGPAPAKLEDTAAEMSSKERLVSKSNAAFKNHHRTTAALHMCESTLAGGVGTRATCTTFPQD